MKLFLPLTLLAALSSPLCAQQTAPAANEAPVVAPEKAPESNDPTIPADRLYLKWKTGGSWESTHGDYVKRAQKGGVNLVFFGDSITQWWGGADFKKRYGALGAVDFGIGGDKTQNLLWRIQNGEMEGITPKVAVVLIGTNNLGSASPDKIAEGIALIVKAIGEKSPATKVLLLGIFPRGWNANEAKWYQGKIQKINSTIAQLDDGKDVRFADLGPQMLEADGTLSRAVFKDGLHPSGEGYTRWAQAMQPLLYEMLELPAPIADAPAAETPAQPQP